MSRRFIFRNAVIFLVRSRCFISGRVVVFAFLVDVVGDDGKFAHDGRKDDLFGFILGFKAGDEIGECLYPIGDHGGHEEQGA